METNRDELIELSKLIEDLEKGVKKKDCRLVKEMLTRIDERWDEFSQGFQEYIQWLYPEVFRLLWENEPFHEYREILELDLFSYGEIYAFFSALSKEIETGTLLEIVDALGMPDYAGEENGLARELVDRESEEIGVFLMEYIKKGVSDRFTDSGMDEDFESKKFSYDNDCAAASDIGSALCILAERRQPGVESFFTGFAGDYPFERDMYMASIVADIFSDYPCDSYYETLIELLMKYPSPFSLRTYFLNSVYTYSRLEALRIAFSDLEKEELANEDRINLLMIIGSWGQDFDFSPSEQSAVEKIFESLDTGNWSRTARGFFAEIINDYFPRMDPNRHSGILDRFAYTMCKQFLKYRLNRKKIWYVLPGIFVIFFIVKRVFDFLAGTPTPGTDYLIYGVLCVWVFVLGITSRSHYLFRESPEDMLMKSLLFWSATLVFLILIAVVYLQILIEGNLGM